MEPRMTMIFMAKVRSDYSSETVQLNLKLFNIDNNKI